MNRRVSVENRIDSILVVDCGTVTTKAMLLDRVGGRYRFVAYGEVPTTLGSEPRPGVTEGVLRAVERISDVTGRRFFDSAGDIISPQVGSQIGVDGFAATTSASEPLQMVVSGLVEDLSIASARRAAAGTYSQIKAVLNGHGPDALADEERVRLIRELAPDVVLIAGGIDGGAERPVLDAAKSATLACALMDREQTPTLVYAGNSRLRRQIAEIVGNEAELRVVENVRPTLETERLIGAQAELRDLFRKRKMAKLVGLNTVARWSPVDVMPTAEAFGRLIRYLWHLGEPTRGVLGVDAGAANTTLAAVFGGRLTLTTYGGLGSAFGGESLLQEELPYDQTRWLPEPLPEHEARGLLSNKRMHPASIPQVDGELWFEQALAREALRATLDIARPGWHPDGVQLSTDGTPLCDTLVISGGVLTQAPRPGQAALMVLDALQPTGISTLVVDTYGLAPALGSVAAVKPLAAVEALDAGVFVNLATAVTPVGEADPGDEILSLTVNYVDGGALDVEVRYGDLEVVPLPLGQEAVLELRPGSGFDVGLGGRGRSGKRRVSGGLAGLIIDARGRPISLPQDPEARCERIRRWLWDVGG
jgi:hypothetical protein